MILKVPRICYSLARMNIPIEVQEKQGLDMSQHSLREVVEKSINLLFELQDPAAGFWDFPFEVDTTIPSEYLMLRRFLDRWDPQVAEKIARHLWSRQNEDGGWPIFHGGKSEISASVKTYFALKLCGFKSDHPGMRRARETILRLGGAENTNVFTKYTLAFFGQYPWNGTPSMPVEVFAFPKWFYFNLYNVSYWSRAVIAPLLVLLHYKPLCRLPQEFQLDEIFADPKAKKSNPLKWSRPVFSYKNFFLLMDKGLKGFEKIPWKPWRKLILKRIENWILNRTGHGGGLGAIYPAMANTVMALRLMGHSLESPAVQSAFTEVEKLLREEGNALMVQACHSPVWDTALSIITLSEAGVPEADPRMRRAAQWLLSKQARVPGDYKTKYPGIEGRGWYFQFHNDIYPDVDDTAVVLLALKRVRLAPEMEKIKLEAVESGLKWLAGMQSNDGGWGAFDKNNNHTRLNAIPFADHGSLLDPSTADVTARAVHALREWGNGRYLFQLEKGIRYLMKEQEPEGCWFGRWGVNYLYGTASVVVALNQIGFSPRHPVLRRAVHWLEAVQNEDGGWGETCLSYADKSLKGRGKSTASQTAWALLGLFCSGETLENKTVSRGIDYLVKTQNSKGSWDEYEFTGTGFPNVFYSRYKGYSHFFPLMVLGQAYQATESKSLNTSSIPG